MDQKSRKPRGKVPAAVAKAPAVVAKAPLVRGEAIVQRVHEAAMQELAEVGYRAFRMEEVAVRAEVNKTTVYRRWPTKAELVRDAIKATSVRKFPFPSTGSLRTDLLALATTFVEHVSTPQGQSMVRMMAAEGADPEIVELARGMREDVECGPQAMIASAVARGELAPDTDHFVLVGALIGALHHRIFFMHEEVGEAFRARLVDLLLVGALQPAARKAEARRAARAASS